MQPEIQNQLRAINQQFYQTFAGPFSATRSRLQAGVHKVLESLPATARLLDLGCGNGNLARALYRQGHKGPYLGMDFSPTLIAETQAALEAPFTFLQADLAMPGWDENIPDSPYDVILAFAVLHHLPGAELRRAVLQRVRAHLVPGGRFTHSNWQFLNSARLRARIQPWEQVGLTDADVDPGDYLLDWRRGGEGLRYVHHFSPEELMGLAAETGFRVLETTWSDGEGGNLGLYQVWEPRED
jgi:SAM-dependent methyltransferase